MDTKSISQDLLRDAEFASAILQPFEQASIAIVTQPRSCSLSGHASLSANLTHAQKLCERNWRWPALRPTMETGNP